MEKEHPSSNLGEGIGITDAQKASLMLFGYSFFEQGRLEEARDIFEGLLMLDPKNPYAHALLGAVHHQQTRFADALICYTRALEFYPQDIQTLANRGEANLNLGKFSEAAADFTAAIQLDEDKKHPAANRARFLVTLTLEALKLAEEKGPQAVLEAQRRIDQQLSSR